MSMLVKGLAALSAFQPKPPTAEYDGLEYRWKAFTFRPAEFKLEAAIIAGLGLYLVWYLLGKAYNMGRAATTVSQYDDIRKSNFALSRPLVASGPAQLLSYSSGRRNVLGLHVTLKLRPFHDLAGLIVDFVKGIVEPTYDSSEHLVFGLTLGRGEAGLQGEGVGVWSIINKSDLKAVKSQRFDLTFPRLQENVAIPFTHSLFTEHSDVNDLILKTANVGVTELLANPTAARLLKYLLITDQPAKRPAKGALPNKVRSREVILSVFKPSSAAEIAAVKAWLQVALNIADVVSKPNALKPEVSRKLASTRKTVDTELGQAYAKELAEDQPAEMTAEEKRLAKKKEQRANMSEKELKRLDELEKKRAMRKMQKSGGYKQQ